MATLRLVKDAVKDDAPLLERRLRAKKPLLLAIDTNPKITDDGKDASSFRTWTQLPTHAPAPVFLKLGQDSAKPRLKLGS